jgi:hypothetical protein
MKRLNRSDCPERSLSDAARLADMVATALVATLRRMNIGMASPAGFEPALSP